MRHKPTALPPPRALVSSETESSETPSVTPIFDVANNLIYSRFALVAGNQGFPFVGGEATAGEQIARVRITSGLNTIVSNGALGNPNDDAVVMDDFIFATSVATPEPSSLGGSGWGLSC